MSVGYKPRRFFLKIAIIIFIFAGAAATTGLYFNIKSA